MFGHYLNTTLTFYGTPFYLLDLAAMGCYLAAWFGYAAYADWQHPKRLSLMSITQTMRLAWMRQMMLRENRIVDAALIGNLQRSITFFASTSIFVLIGLVSMLGYRDKGIEVLGSIPFTLPTTSFMWEFKILLMAFVFIYSFFKYTWSLRLYNYASIYVGAAPPHEECRARPEEAERYAQRGGMLIANAGKHFNMGLRAYYFGLAVLSWFLHPLLFILAIGWVIHEIYRREFRSKTVNNLAEMG